MQWEVLVVTIHIGGVGIGKSLIQSNWSLDGLVLRVEHLRHITLQLVALRLHILDREADHCASNLNRHRVLCLEPQLLFQQDDGSKLGGVVLDIEAILLALYDGVTSTHADVVDTHLTLMATS